MNEIRTLLNIAARRLSWSTFLAHAHLVAVVLAAIALVLMVSERLGATTFVPWLWVAPLLVGLGLLAAAVRWRRHLRNEHQVALAVDDRLELAEKLSTALHCHGRTDPFAQAAIEDAVKVASDPRTREVTRRRFAVSAPRGWWLSPLLVLLALVVSLVNPLDLFGREEDAEQQQQIVEARDAADATVDAVVKQIKDNPELGAEMKELLGELTQDGFDPEAMKSPEQVKRDALKKVSEINKRLEDLLSGEKGKTAEALERALSRLKSPPDGDAKDLAEAMSRGDFTDAQKALQKMMEKLEQGGMDQEQQEALAEQLKDIAEQLQQLAQQQQQLQQALQQAGLDPNLANNLEALQQALQNNPNLNQQQIQQIQQMAQAQQAAAQMCQNLGQACQQMAQAMAQGQMGQLGQAGQGMGDQLNQMEQLKMLLQQAQAAANACQGQCMGLGQGLGLQPGGAFGGRGQGAGGKAPLAPTPWGKRIIKADVNTDPGGDIIARMLIDGPQYVGESRKTAQRIIAERLEGYDEALAEERFPRKYEDAHLHYFGELQRLTEVQAANGGGGESSPEPTPEATGEPADAGEASD